MVLGNLFQEVVHQEVVVLLERRLERLDLVEPVVHLVKHMVHLDQQVLLDQQDQLDQVV